MIAAAERLEQLLARGTKANADAWKKYLHWDELQELTAAPSPTPEAVVPVMAPYFRGQTGMALAPFVDVREALVAYSRVLKARSDPDAGQQLAEQVLGLREAVKKLESDPAEAATEMAVRLEWMEQLGQARDLVGPIRDRFGRPNVFASVSAGLIAKRFNVPVSETLPVQETILGTPIRGQAHTLGTITARLIPSDQDALIELAMTGTASSDTIGYRPPVRIYSDGQTQVSVRKQLWVGDVGVWTEPATASCSTRTRTRSIRTANRLGSGIVRAFAWKQLRAQKAKAEWISARRAEVRAAQRMDQQVLDVIASGNGQWESKLRRPLRRMHLYPRMLRLWSTAQRLHLAALEGRRCTIGSVGHAAGLSGKRGDGTGPRVSVSERRPECCRWDADHRSPGQGSG